MLSGFGRLVGDVISDSPPSAGTSGADLGATGAWFERAPSRAPPSVTDGVRECERWRDRCALDGTDEALLDPDSDLPCLRRCCPSLRRLVWVPSVVALCSVVHVASLASWTGVLLRGGLRRGWCALCCASVGVACPVGATVSPPSPSGTFLCTLRRCRRSPWGEDVRESPLEEGGRLCPLRCLPSCRSWPPLRLLCPPLLRLELCLLLLRAPPLCWLPSFDLRLRTRFRESSPTAASPIAGASSVTSMLAVVVGLAVADSPLSVGSPPGARWPARSLSGLERDTRLERCAVRAAFLLLPRCALGHT